MRLFNQMTIKQRMTLSFVLIIALFAVYGVISIREMNTLSRLTATLYNHPLQVSNASLKAKAGIISMHRSMKDVSISKTPMAISLAIKKVQDEEQKVYQEFDLIRQLILGEAGHQLIGETIELFAGWKPIRVEVEGFVLQGDTESANRITREKGADYVARLELKMSELTAYALNKADGFMTDADQERTRIMTSVFAFIAFLIALSLAIGYFISASILSSISSLQTTMTRITESGQLEEVRLQGHNEITDMAGHFNNLVRRLRNQFWLQDGENALNNALSGTLTYDAIASQSLDHICRRLDACSGALYNFSPEDRACYLTSHFAGLKGRQFKGAFDLGQGIVGQAAADRQSILLNNVTPEDALVRGASFSRPPNALIAVPLFYEDALFGVMEIASFSPIDEIRQRYLESAARILSVMLFSADQNRQIQDLLATSQEANEQLQEQTEELQVQTEELQALNLEFKQQSSELKERNIQLERQRRQVEAANQLKSEFLSNMSHELRTPLNSINALSRVLTLQASQKLSAEEVNYLKIIERNGKHLLSLINDILDLSKIEAGKMEISLSRFHVETGIGDLVERMAPLADEKGIHIKTNLPQDLPEIESDESRVRQILQNIIANAVKFTDKGGVTISSRGRPGGIEITIEDTGIGIASQNLDKIFEAFRQVDGATTRKFEGTGLGLSIAFKSAKLLGGDIFVSSEPDKGSRFTVTLPLVYSGPGLSSARDRQVTEPAGFSSPNQDKKTILVVDDDGDMARTIASVLSAKGFNAMTATSGQQAISMAGTHELFAITLDVIMPDMDGWEVLGKLKQNPKTAAIPVIIISVSSDRDTGFALGALGYVTKPVSRERIIKEINRIFGQLPSRIMVADDSLTDRARMVQMLRSEGMIVIEAEDGRSCLDMLETGLPDVLVLDLIMPGMDGFKVLEHIRNNPVSASLPVIVVTAKDLSPEEKAGLEQRVSSVIEKDGFVVHRLAADIKRVLDQVGERGMLQESDTIEITDRVLVVDDDEAGIIQVKWLLGSMGIQTDIAHDSQKALDYLSRTIPKAVILDMPDIDGVQVLEMLRAAPLTRDVPVLVLTAKDLTPEDMDRLSHCRVSHLVQKGGIDQKAFLVMVRQMILPEESGDNPTESVSQTPGLGQVFSDKGRRVRPLGRPKVLVIEDNPDNMVTIKAVLPDSLVIQEAVDGNQGLAMAAGWLPDLILLDMALPGKDGIQVVKALKKEASTALIPVIALTAQAMKGDRERIITAGCDDYIPKPIDPDGIVQKVNFWLTQAAKEAP